MSTGEPSCQELAQSDNRARAKREKLSRREKFEALDQRRVAADVGISELCGLAGISRETWRLIAAGKTDPYPATLRKLRRGLDRLLAETIDPRR